MKLSKMNIFLLNLTYYTFIVGMVALTISII